MAALKGRLKHEITYACGCNINGRLKGAVDRELGGKYIRICSPIFDVWHFCGKHICLVRVLRIHPVQSVIHNITQLTGRGFPCIFYIKLRFRQNYTFLVRPNGSRAVNTWQFENLNFYFCFENLKKTELVMFSRLGFHFGARKKRKVATKISYKRYREILFQKVASGYLLHFVQDGSSKNAL